MIWISMYGIHPLWFILNILRRDFLIFFMTDTTREILLDQETEVEKTCINAEYAN